MIIKKKYLGLSTGFIRFKKFEINYSLYDWALPYTYEKNNNKRFYRLFFISIIL